MTGDGFKCTGRGSQIAGSINITLTIDNGLITPIADDFIPEITDDLCAQIRKTKPHFDCSNLIVNVNPGSGPAVITITILPPYGNVVGDIQHNIYNNGSWNGTWTQYIDPRARSPVEARVTVQCDDGSYRLECTPSTTTKDNFLTIALIVAGAVVGAVLLVGGLVYWKAHRDEKQSTLSKTKLDAQPSFNSSNNAKPDNVYLFVPSTAGTTQASSPGGQTPMFNGSSPASPGDRTPPHVDILPPVSEVDSSAPLGISPAASGTTIASAAPSALALDSPHASEAPAVLLADSPHASDLAAAHAVDVVDTSDPIPASAVNIAMETGDAPQ